MQRPAQSTILNVAMRGFDGRSAVRGGAINQTTETWSTQRKIKLLCHLAQAEDKFEIARGERGMVMTVFTEHHNELFGVEFWQSMQDCIKAGEVIHVFPYPSGKHLSDKWES